MNNVLNKSGIFFLFLFLPTIMLAQNNNLPSSKEEHELTITGYLQTQYQRAQSPGVVTFSGGDFGKDSRERFMIRRGRLKIDRVDKFTNVVFQLDGTQNGVQLMDAFIQVHDPNRKEFTLTAGLFNRPFGYSIVYSSGYRDYPERARVFQTLMPRERDLGAMLGYNPLGKLNFLTAEFAVINGSGISARDYDSKKDIVGSLSFKFDSLAFNKLGIGFGGSFYQGHVRNNTQTIYRSAKGGYRADIDPNNEGAFGARNYYGVNLQLEYKTSIGLASFKTEYVAGTQPGVEGTSSIKGPTSSMSFTTQPLTSLYVRPFNGYYFWVGQELWKTRLTAILAYDVYDANTDVKGLEIGRAGSNTNSGDIKYATLGYGLTYDLSKQIKLTLYNEHIKNENTLVPEYTNDIKDNVFTTRLQYRW